MRFLKLMGGYGSQEGMFGAYRDINSAAKRLGGAISPIAWRVRGGGSRPFEAVGWNAKASFARDPRDPPRHELYTASDSTRCHYFLSTSPLTLTYRIFYTVSLLLTKLTSRSFAPLSPLSPNPPLLCLYGSFSFKNARISDGGSTSTKTRSSGRTDSI